MNVIQFNLSFVFTFFVLWNFRLNGIRPASSQSATLTFIPNQLMLIVFVIVCVHGCFPRSLYNSLTQEIANWFTAISHAKKRWNFSNFLAMCLLTFLSKKAKFNYVFRKKNNNNTNISNQLAPHESIWYENFYLLGHFSSMVVPKIFRIRALAERNWTPDTKGKFKSHYGFLCL